VCKDAVALALFMGRNQHTTIGSPGHLRNVDQVGAEGGRALKRFRVSFLPEVVIFEDVSPPQSAFRAAQEALAIAAVKPRIKFFVRVKGDGGYKAR
jgi:hypothetical protein